MTHDDYANYDEEWKSCRETVAKFDGTLIDLRKYGFTIITSLLTAGSFLGFNAPTAPLQAGVIIVTMTLIVILYWMDIYYQNLLVGSILRTNFLEIFRVHRGLSYYISKLYGRSGMGAGLHILYGGFLFAAFILGMFAATLSENLDATNQTRNSECKLPMKLCAEAYSLIISLILGGIGILLIFLLFDQVRSKNSKIISRIIEIRKKELDNLTRDRSYNTKKENKIQEAENDIYKVLTNPIGFFELWNLPGKETQEFLDEIEKL
jgi:hypothetical protein